MAAAVLLGSLAQSTDTSSPRNAAFSANHQLRSCTATAAATSSSIFGGGGKNRNPSPVVTSQKRSNRSANAGVVSFAGGEGSEENDENGGEWEEKLRSRIKEPEEMKEL